MPAVLPRPLRSRAAVAVCAAAALIASLALSVSPNPALAEGPATAPGQATLAGTLEQFALSYRPGTSPSSSGPADTFRVVVGDRRIQLSYEALQQVRSTGLAAKTHVLATVDPAAPGGELVTALERDRGYYRNVAFARTAGTSSGSGSLAAATPDSAPPVGARRIVAVPVTFNGTTMDVTSAQVAPKLDELVNYYTAASFGTAQLSYVQAPSFAYGTSPPTADQCQSFEFPLADNVRASLEAKGILRQYDHVLMYWASGVVPCSYSGLANLGGYNLWINGLNNPYTLQTLGHEFGHNIGLDHSGKLRCFTDASHQNRTAFSADCGGLEYYDPYSIMGSSGNGHMSAQHAEIMGLIGASQIVRVGNSSSFRLAPLGLNAGVRSAKIATPHGLLTLEYRLAQGLDAGIGATYDPDGDGPIGPLGDPGTGVLTRLQVTTGPGYVAQEALLLSPHADLYPTRDDNLAMGLAAGENLTVGTVTIAVTAADQSGANITVTLPADTTPPEAFQAYAVGYDATAKNLVASWVLPTDDRFVDRQDVFVDGVRFATVGPDADLAVLPVRPSTGVHTLTTRAFDTSGNSTLSPPLEFTVSELVRFTTTPRQSVALNRRVSASVVPLRLGWNYTGSACYTMVNSVYTDGKAAIVNVSANVARSSTVTLGVCEYDQPEFVRAASPYRTAVLVTSQGTGLAGTWSSATATAALGGSERVTRTLNASYTYQVAGIGTALVARRGPGRSQMAVLLDGRRVATVDLNASTLTPPTTVWVGSWASGTHTVKLVNLATQYRTLGSLDAVVALR